MPIIRWRQEKIPNWSVAKIAANALFLATLGGQSLGATLNLKIANKTTELGWKLIQESADGNAVSGPLSVWLSLAMVHAGANGATAAEMANVLGFSSDPEGIPSAAAAIQKNLIQLSQDEIKLAIANRVFPQLGDKLKQSFLDSLAKNYHSSPGLLDFQQDPEDSRKKINSWVAENTNGKIPDLLDRGTVTKETKIVLANAMYFKARWENPFPKSETVEDTFHINAKTLAKVSFMQQTREFRVGHFGSGKTASVVCEIPYQNNKLAMILIVPKNIDGVEDVLKDLLVSPSLQSIEAKSQLTLQDIELHIPKWTARGKLNLRSFLQKLGMVRAFDSRQADLSGIDGRKDLSLSEVIHGGFIDVSEESTEAAAATATGMDGAQEIPQINPPLVVKADRPFLWRIVEKSSGTTLFSGRVTDPRN